MTFTDIPQGASVFIDANTLIYHLAPDPDFRPACQDLLERCARQELAGFTSAHLVSNVAHRIMTLEAMDRFGWPTAGIGRRLLRHPENLRLLTRFRQAVDEIPGFGIQVLPVTMRLVSAASAARRLDRHRGRRERHSGWGFNPPFALAVGRGSRSPSVTNRDVSNEAKPEHDRDARPFLVYRSPAPRCGRIHKQRPQLDC